MSFKLLKSKIKKMASRLLSIVGKKVQTKSSRLETRNYGLSQMLIIKKIIVVEYKY